jgi:hypothetical protein
LSLVNVLESYISSASTHLNQPFGAIMKRVLFSFFVAFLVHGADAQPSNARGLTNEIANDVVIYSMMASNAYADDKKKLKFPIEELGWKKIDLRGNPVSDEKNSYTSKTFVGSIFSNLQFDIWEDTKSKKTIIAFKGTMEIMDWTGGNLSVGISIPYKSAKKHVREYISKHPERTVSVTGHSLGGGLALSVSFWEGVDAVVFNTSPRIFDGLSDANASAKRLSIFQEGEILQKIRKWYPKFLEKVQPEQIIETSFDYPGGTSHRSDFLAEGLLACATAPELSKISNSINNPIPCYLK